MKFHIDGAKAFVVYAHSRDGVRFYIGKGSVKRAFDFSASGQRTKAWRAEVAKGDFDVEIMSLHATEEECLAWENVAIELFQPSANSSGLGKSRRAQTRAWRVREAGGHIHNGEWRGRVHQANRLRVWTPESREKLRASLALARLRGRRFGRPKIAVKCLETDIRFDSVAEAAAAMGLRPQGVARVARGDRNHYRGFHFVALDKHTQDAVGV